MTSIPIENQRVKRVIDFTTNGNVLQFSKEIGISQPRINRLFTIDSRSGKYPLVSFEIVQAIINKFVNIDAEWLILGKGDMLKLHNNNEVDKGLPVINYNRLPSVITISEKDEEKENIEIVPAKLAAGYVGGGYAEESFVLDLPKFRLPYLNNGTFRCFGVSGHSMNRVQDEDWFVGKFVDNIRNFNEGKIHAVIAPKAESLLIKRVFRHPKKMDTLILRSDSNDESNIYPDIHMPISLIAEMWSYTALISFKEPLFDAVKFKEIAKTAPEFIDVKDYFS